MVAIFREGEFLAVDDGKVISKLTFSEIEEVYALKEDCFSYDEVLLHVKFSDDLICEATEGTKVFDQISEKLESDLPGMKKDWFNDVTDPPFETNHTLLWRRP